MPPTTDESNAITQAFASPIAYWTFDQSELNGRLAASIRSMAASTPSDDEHRAHRGGFYSRGGFFASGLDGASELSALAHKSVRRYIASLTSHDYAKEVDLRFTTWVALTRQGDYQTPHVHFGSTISGVYYVCVPACPPPQGCLEFITPVGEQEMSFLRPMRASRVTIQVKAGGLVLFPSYLRHYTQPFEGEGDRICVVFNVEVEPRRRGASN